MITQLNKKMLTKTMFSKCAHFDFVKTDKLMYPNIYSSEICIYFQ